MFWTDFFFMYAKIRTSFCGSRLLWKWIFYFFFFFPNNNEKIFGCSRARAPENFQVPSSCSAVEWDYCLKEHSIVSNFGLNGPRTYFSGGEIMEHFQKTFPSATAPHPRFAWAAATTPLLKKFPSQNNFKIYILAGKILSNILRMWA